MKSILKYSSSSHHFKKQKGATLVTALVFLLLMTMLSVTASKVSMIDILIAGNNQQKMILYQDTHNQLKDTATIEKLNVTFTENGFTSNVTGTDDLFDFSNSPNNIDERITDLQIEYPCKRDGLGSSIGPNAPPCDLYDFRVRARLQNSNAVDQHHRGAGKMIPNAGSKGSLL